MLDLPNTVQFRLYELHLYERNFCSAWLIELQPSSRYLNLKQALIIWTLTEILLSKLSLISYYLNFNWDPIMWTSSKLLLFEP